MAMKREFWGETPQGAPVYVYHLSNENGMEVCVLNYGAIIRNIFVPDKDGGRKDVALGFEKLEEYFSNDVFFGATIGPCGNRTANASFRIGDQTFHMPVNDNGRNNLHSDHANGFHKRVWDDVSENENSVSFLLEAPDGDLGFPGNRKAMLTFEVTPDNALTLYYQVTSDADTWVNMTNHCYFNLGGHDAGSIAQHIVQFQASAYTPVTEDLIPTGEILQVKGTPFDFTRPKTIGQEIDAQDVQMVRGGGYDHNFVIDREVSADGTIDATKKPFASVTNPATGITMHCETTLPAFQFYTGNMMPDTLAGKGGVQYHRRDAFCLETQYFPNAINTEGFYSPLCGVGKSYKSTTSYRFS